MSANIRSAAIMCPSSKSLASPVTRPLAQMISQFRASSPVNIILNRRRARVKGIIEMLKKVVDRIFFLLGWYGRSDLEGMGRAAVMEKGAREISKLHSLSPQSKPE